jgi:LmbE family N-acetylglucosaminyl deacetylase
LTEPLIVSAADRILIFAPHPDDETLATGGLIQRALDHGAEVRVVFATDGENNPWAQRAVEWRWRIGLADRERWGERRRGEALAALECLGVSSTHTTFMGYPDQGLQRLLLAGDDDLCEAITAEVTTFRPSLLVAPSLEDLHPDHSALAIFLRRALDRLEPRERPRERDFVVHHDGPVMPAPGAQRLVLSHEERERKRRAILSHASQLRLRRDVLLEFADGDELFLPPGHAAFHNGRHPLRDAVMDGDALVLEIERHSRFGAFGPTDLLLSLDRPEARETLAARLPRRSGALELYHRASGTLVARGEWQAARRGRAETAILPARVLAGSLRAFAKLERRFGFFDEAGWRALPVPARAGEPTRPIAARARAAAPSGSGAVVRVQQSPGDSH